MRNVARTWGVLLVLGAAAWAGTVAPTADHPAPNSLKPLGKRRFYVSSKYFLRNWALLGLWQFDRTKYPTEQCTGHMKVEPVANEAALEPHIGAKVDGRTWLLYKPSPLADTHYVDLTAFYKNMPRHTICFAAADVYCEAAIADAILLFGCADSCRVYLNGKLIHTYDEKRRSAEPDTDKITGLALKKGWNRLVCKVGNVMHGAGMYARFADAKGFPIQVECPKLEPKQEYAPPEVKAGKGKAVGTVDLTGEWKIQADPKALGVKANWAAAAHDDADWKTIRVPGFWEDTLKASEKGKLGYYVFVETWQTTRGLFNGIAWYRRTATVPAAWKGKRVYLELGSVVDYDWAYVNGTLVGVTDYADSQQSWRQLQRRYRVPETALLFGKPNVIAVQVFNVDGGGGIVGPKVRLVAEEPAGR